MPHTLIKFGGFNIAKIVSTQMAYIEASLIQIGNQKVNQLINRLLQTCPPPAVINSIFKQKESIERLFNGYDNKIQRFNKLASKVDPIITSFKVLVDLLSHLPVPTTIGIPPGPAGGVIFSMPAGLVQGQSAMLTKYIKVVEDLENEKEAIKSLVGDTVGIFDPIKVRLQQIDVLCSHCIRNPFSELDTNARVINPFLMDSDDLSNRNLLKQAFGKPGDTTLEQDIYSTLSSEGLVGTCSLGPEYQTRQQCENAGGRWREGRGQVEDVPGNLTQSQLNTAYAGTGIGKDSDNTQGGESYRSPSGILYTLKIEKDPESPPIAIRKRAIAVDFRGIAVLRGPFSFSSSDKVLRDEIKFRINNQLP